MANAIPVKNSILKLYLENPELLLVLNNKLINTFRPDTGRNGLYVRLSPDTYRLDLDPAGYPLDWKPIETAYMVAPPNPIP